MAGEFGMDVNTVEYYAAVQKLRAGVAAGFIEPQFGLLPVQGRLLSEKCQQLTPPQNVGQGKAAVARDITKIFRPLSHTTFRVKSLQRIVKKDDRPAWDAAAVHFGTEHHLRDTHAIGFSEDFHRANRDRRGRAKATNVVTLGGEARAVRRYISKVKKAVGWAKAGWNAGIIGLGGAVKAAWLGRHGRGHGGYQNANQGPDPFVRVWNTTGWAKYRNDEGNRILRNAVSFRARDMASYFDRMMRLAAKKAGFSQTG